MEKSLLRLSKVRWLKIAFGKVPFQDCIKWGIPYLSRDLRQHIVFSSGLENFTRISLTSTSVQEAAQEKLATSVQD